MKIFILILVFLTGSVEHIEQFGVIRDKDGFCNVRNKSKKSNKIIDKLNNEHIVFCFDKEDNWSNIDYEKNGQVNQGQVYHDRIILMSQLNKFVSKRQNENKTTLKLDSFQIDIEITKFEKSKHKLSFHKDYKEALDKIDGKQFWGTDGGIPKVEYKRISVKIGTITIDLPQSSFQDLYEVSIWHSKAFFDKSTNSIYIQASNSDGAGSYYTIWRIKDGKYDKRYIAYGF